uniref:Uncharacterized protein n=1 Tax=Acrobeloides nanus TaxID=290746 RepID=A0A914DG34_9BILA
SFGIDLSGISNMNIGGQRLGNVVDQVAAQVLDNFHAPPPGSDIPPHVYRRIVRFCTRHPNHPRCSGHREWIAPAGSNLGQVGNDFNLNNVFPDFVPFRLPPVPQMALQNFLSGVPTFLQQVVPQATLGNIDEGSKQRVRNNCRATGTCKRQDKDSLNKRAIIAEHEASVRRSLNPNWRQQDIDNNVELRMSRTFQVKQALLRQAGLDNEVLVLSYKGSWN